MPLTRAAEFAMAYAERGWRVFPARLDERGKASYKSAARNDGRKWGWSTDPSEIRRDFARWPRAGVGILTGAESGIFVVDADTLEGHGVDGLATLRAIEVRHGALPDTLTAESPSGSRHLYLEHPCGGSYVRSFTLAPGVDVKGDGGTITAPPTVTPRGTYRWLNRRPVARAPDWLLDAVLAEPVRRNDADVIREVVPHRMLRAALDAIRNDNISWDDWNRVGMAVWVVTEGEDYGLAEFDRWSRKSRKYSAEATARKWAAYRVSPPQRIGWGTLAFLAARADPNWDDIYVLGEWNNAR